MNSSNVTVIGLQWGDEGKGKIVDALAGVSKYVVRFCGGANAGHTVEVGDQKYALHLIPCGVLTEGVTNVVGNGVAFDPAVACEEIAGLEARGIMLGPDNMIVSANAHMVMPWHKTEDILSEKALADGKKIGTTARGIGPCYADKARRSTAIRTGELLDTEKLSARIREIAAIKNKYFQALYDQAPLDADGIIADYIEYARSLGPLIANTGAILRQAITDGEAILFEGGQGSMLDIDHGTYPFVTSSPVTACGVPTGAGIAPSAIGIVVGLIKAYTTRVGAGPFPSEQDNQTGEYLREKGHEYGTTTGRPRRCGWFDATAVRYAADISGVDELALSLLDVLSGLDELKICTGYIVDGEKMTQFDPAVMDRAECVYETLPGWSQDITACKTYDELPEAARNYVDTVERIVGRTIGFISVGPERTQTIFHNTKVKGLK